MYVANIGNSTGAQISSAGLRILDVSEIQDRKPDPQVRVLADLTWPEVSIPQVAEPFTKNGHQYLLEVDEYANYSPAGGADQASSPVGAARIIDVDDPRHPRVVSNLRLQVHQPGARKGDQQNDPGAALPVQGYAGHYCSVPRRHAPRIVGLLDDRVRPAHLRHQRPDPPGGGGLLQPPAHRHQARQPDGPGRRSRCRSPRGT